MRQSSSLFYLFIVVVLNLIRHNRYVGRVAAEQLRHSAHWIANLKCGDKAVISFSLSEHEKCIFTDRKHDNRLIYKRGTVLPATYAAVVHVAAPRANDRRRKEYAVELRR